MKNILKYGSVLIAGIVSEAALYAFSTGIFYTADDALPNNYVKVTHRIDTAGQPSTAQLRGLKAAGYDLVTNLAT
ncbi:MAG TPA: hypothetical protein VIM41_01875 [Gammaproteobacteria bacterium]